MRELAELALLTGALAIAASFIAVPTWVLIGIPLAKLVTSAAVYTLLLRRTFRGPPRGGADALIGDRAKAIGPLQPTGQVKVGGEIWSARSADGHVIARDEDVEIVGRERSTVLIVRTARENRQRQSEDRYWNSSEPR